MPLALDCAEAFNERNIIKSVKYFINVRVSSKDKEYKTSREIMQANDYQHDYFLIKPLKISCVINFFVH